ncbi:MAG: hypothetical protein V4638_03460 [Bacteroidota bacterium]
MKILQLLFLVGIMSSCSTETPETPEVKMVLEKDLVDIKDGVYTEWYPGKKQIKFRGMQDEASKRDGKWTYYSEKGEELSITFYEHGLRNGHTIVKHPNGAIHYTGEYRNDTVVGIWTTYDQNGKVISKEDHSKD